MYCSDHMAIQGQLNSGSELRLMSYGTQLSKSSSALMFDDIILELIIEDTEYVVEYTVYLPMYVIYQG